MIATSKIGIQFDNWVPIFLFFKIKKTGLKRVGAL